MNETRGDYSVARFVRPHRSRLGLVLLIMLASAFLGLLNPWFLQQLIDRVLLARRPDLLWIFAAVILGVALFRFGVGVLQSYVFAGVTARILFDMRRDFLEHLQRLSLVFFSRTRFGDIITRFNRDLSLLQEIATGALLGFITNLLTLTGTIAWALWYDWQLFLLAAIPFPLALLVARLFRERVRDLARRLRELSSDFASLVVETITGMRTIRSFGRERGELARFARKGHELIRRILSFQLTSSFASGLPRILLVVSTVIIYTAGGSQVIHGEMGLGSLVALSLYVGMIYPALQSLVELYLQLVQARVSLDRVREIRELPLEIDEDPRAPLPAPVRGEIRFEDVVFSYRKEQPVLRGLSFAVAAGETVALVGRSGAGKSTIVDLLFRFLDPETGRVLIDEQDLRHVRVSRIRDRMAVVTQETFLFHDTLYENIRYGSPIATRQQVREAAGLAGLEPTLAALPEGLDTTVGERGLQLSGGQRQRIAIARALLRQPAILILDEATSSLDYASDRDIRRGIERLMENATTLVITHRLSTLVGVDRILVLEEGRIVEEGSPAELSARGGAYLRMLDGWEQGVEPPATT